MLCSFLSMQLPSGIINLIILIFAFIYFLKINKNHFYYFLIGAAISLLLLFIYLIYVDINLKDFVIQIILFPLSIGEGRILNDEKAYRGLQIGSSLCKILIVIIIKRIQKWYELQLTDEQQGFRRGRGTTDGIYIAKRIHTIISKETPGLCLIHRPNCCV